MLSTLDDKVAATVAAVVVVDMQNDFVAEGGFFAALGADVNVMQQTLIPALTELLGEARAAGVPVIFVRAIYDERFRSEAMNERKRRAQSARWPCEEGTWGAQFAVPPRSDELVITKHRYSAMINTELDAALRAQRVHSLLFAGVATDTCVESTARDASFMDYYVSIVADCCAALTQSDHEGALARFARDYGEVMQSADVVGAWRRQAHPRATSSSETTLHCNP